MLVFSLVRKDLRLHKRYLAVSAALYTLYMAYIAGRTSRPMVTVVFASLLFSMLPFSVAGREDRFKSVVFSLSLPVRRRDLVLSRYALGWLLMPPLYAAMALLSKLVPGTLNDTGALLRPHAVLSAVVFMTLITGLLLPFVLRYGLVGLMAVLIALQILFVIVLILGRATEFSLRSVLAWFPGLVRGTIEALGPVGAGLAVLAACALVQASSFAVAARLYARRDF